MHSCSVSPFPDLISLLLAPVPTVLESRAFPLQICPEIKVPSSFLGKEKLLGFRGRGCVFSSDPYLGPPFYHGLNLLKVL